MYQLIFEDLEGKPEFQMVEKITENCHLVKFRLGEATESTSLSLFNSKKSLKSQKGEESDKTVNDKALSKISVMADRKVK